jgi:hypothetical protein
LPIKDWVSVGTAGFRLIGRFTWSYFVWCAIAAVVVAAAGRLLGAGLFVFGRTPAIATVGRFGVEALIVALPCILAPVTCAIYRAELQPAAGGFAFLHFGAQEIRVAIASAGLGLFWAVASYFIVDLYRDHDPARYLLLAAVVGLSAVFSFVMPAAFMGPRLDPAAAVRLAIANFRGLLALTVASWLAFAAGTLLLIAGWAQVWKLLSPFDNFYSYTRGSTDWWTPLLSLRQILNLVLGATAAVAILAPGAAAYARLAPQDDTDPEVFA